MEEIRNRVQESGIITLDLADYKPKVKIVSLDIADQLWQGIALKEKEYRSWIKEHDWASYTDAAVHIHCSADAIVPTWAYMLASSALLPHTSKVLVGEKIDLEKELIKNEINLLENEQFVDARIIIKGCSDIASPEFAMVELMKKLQPLAKSIMYGEPCSAVPVFKKR